MNFIAIDFETANRNRSSICSVGIAVVEGGKITNTEHIYIKPTPNYYESINVSIHGITDRDTRNKMTFQQQWGQLRKYFDRQTIVAHNAAFDCSALRSSLDCSALTYPDLDYHCTLCLTKKVLPLQNHKLDEVSRHFKIRLNHHNAESDAIAAALIAIRLCEQFKADSLEELSINLGFKVGKICSENNSYKTFSKIKTRK